jgi:hypothetical protein
VRRFPAFRDSQPPRALPAAAMEAAQHVSFDNAVDLVDYRMSQIEVLLKASVSSTEFVAQEIMCIFVAFLVLSALASFRHY